MFKALWITGLILVGGISMAQESTLPFQIKTEPGWVIFDPTKDGEAYRYGPSIIINEDGSLDVWFASPGGPGEEGTHQWDWIRHKRSMDGGKTWSPETIVLKPTEGSMDKFSVCDPGVIRFGGYYYLGVTAVDELEGNCNEIFVARSKSATGPFEKWDGAGWSGAPKPLISFNEPRDVWGAGEPSFVLKGQTLYIYYTIISKTPEGTPINQTHVATAPADDPNWPGKIMFSGMAYDRTGPAEDSTDVKYVDGFKCFLSVATAERMGPNSHIVLRVSGDGLRFGPPTRITENIQLRCHNAGISGNAEGHLDLSKKNFIAYAYGDGTRPDPSWAFWHTFLTPFVIEPLNP